MGIIKVTSLGSTVSITIKYWEDNFVPGLGVKNYMAEGQGKVWLAVGEYLLQGETLVETLLPGIYWQVIVFLTTYVHMEGKFQCDSEYFKASKTFHSSSIQPFSHAH